MCDLEHYHLVILDTRYLGALILLLSQARNARGYGGIVIKEVIMEGVGVRPTKRFTDTYIIECDDVYYQSRFTLIDAVISNPIGYGIKGNITQVSDSGRAITFEYDNDNCSCRYDENEVLVKDCDCGTWSETFDYKRKHYTYSF